MSPLRTLFLQMHCGYIGTLLFTLVQLSPLLAAGLPVTFPWEQPCGTTSSESWSVPSNSYVAEDIVVHNLLNLMKDTLSLVESLKKHYVRHRVQNVLSSVPCEVNINEQIGDLEGFPKANNNMCLHANLTVEFSKDYKDISLMYLFNNQSWNDEILSNSFSNVSQMYGHLLLPKQPGSILHILCQMFSHNDEHGAPISSFITPTQLPQKYTNGSETENHIRDFKILSQSSDLLSKLITKYGFKYDVLLNSH